MEEARAEDPRAELGIESAAFRPGVREDFERLYRASYPKIFRTLVALLGDTHLAEDCTQDAFVKAYRSWGSFKPEAPAEAWVHRIAINTAISARRRQRLREVGEVIRRLGRPSVQDPIEGVFADGLLEELRRLPPKQASMIVLRHLHGYSNREIGASLGISESTVASRLMAAKATLRARLRDISAGPDTSTGPGVIPRE